jgi:hypothetical protein
VPATPAAAKNDQEQRAGRTEQDRLGQKPVFVVDRETGHHATDLLLGPDQSRSDILADHEDDHGHHPGDRGHAVTSEMLHCLASLAGHREVLLAALLHLISSRRGASRDTVWRQIAKASSSNATAKRRATGSSIASS